MIKQVYGLFLLINMLSVTAFWIKLIQCAELASLILFIMLLVYSPSILAAFKYFMG